MPTARHASKPSILETHHALCRAAAGWSDEKPDWLVAREEAEEEKLDVEDTDVS